MIPKLFHRIWLGPRPIPAYANVYWEAFQELHPDWGFLTWREYPYWGKLRSQFDESVTWAGRSGIMRWELLEHFGGIYVDTDEEPLRPFEDLLDHGVFLGEVLEPTGLYLGTGVIGCEPHHPAARAYIDGLPARFHDEPEDESAWGKQSWRVGPRFVTDLIGGREDVTRLPEIAFYPIPQGVPVKRPYPKEAYAVHHWAFDWADVSP